MTTEARTVTQTRYVRTWLDFDPKFLAAAAVLALTLVVEVVRLTAGAVTVTAAGAELGPVALAAAAAYVATSSHRTVLEEDLQRAAEIVATAAPIVRQVAPEAVPAVEIVQDGVGAIQAALAEGASDPVPHLP